VVLSLQLPFVLFPLTRMTGDKALMGKFANGPMVAVGAWGIFLLISAANVLLLADMAAG